MTESVPSWAALLALGAFHGVNPGMGWLFAVALGMQERSARAVWLALVPLGLGHALAIGLTILVAAAFGTLLSSQGLRVCIALVLVGLGVYRLIRQRHPRWRGMRVGVAGLTAWSFLMASAHGAGLMTLPFVLRVSTPAHGHQAHAGAISTLSTSLAATAIHGVGYLVATAIAALIAWKAGLALLRTAWINLDVIWAVALIATGALSLFM